MPIWKQRLFSRLQDQQSGDGGDGGGGSKPQITPEVQALIDAAVSSQVSGLKSKNAELLGKVKDYQTNLQRFEGIDPDAVRNILKRFSDDEEAALLAKGEIDTVLNKRTERMQQDFQKKLDAATQAAEAASKRATAYQGRVLDDSLRAAAAKAGIHTHAVDDALLNGRTIFALDDAGQAVALGADGRPVLGKDGKTPLTPTEWLESMKETKPHWFPASASGGGSGGGKGNGGSQQYKKAGDMSAAEKAAFISANGVAAWSSKVSTDYAR